MCLTDGRGKLYRARRMDDHPFFGLALGALAARCIAARAEAVHGSTLIVKSWSELEP